MNYLQLIISASLLAALAACGETTSPEPSGEEQHAEEGHAEEPGHIELSAERARAAGIEIAAVGSATIREVLSLYGTVQPNAERVREVTPRYPGVVLNVMRKVGESVRKGDVLATVESNESLRTYEILAPLSGVVTARTANPGEYAGEAPVFTIADLSTVWVELALFPRDLAKVRVGQGVRVKSVDGGLHADGKVVFVASLGQSATQTLTARVLLDNAERVWAPGLYVTGDVTLSEASVPVAVKSGAIQTIGGEPTIFVVEGEGFAARKVSVGRADSDYTEVRSGLEPESRYAATNSFVLKSELGKGETDHGH